MKFIKIIGLLCLICFTFFYTEKIIDISIEQDEIMTKIKEVENTYNINAINATIKDNTIIPGNSGKQIDEQSSYKSMKKIGYYDESLLVYSKVYPEISIYNNYNKYIIKGNTSSKNVALIYIISNDKTIDNVIDIVDNNKTYINFFIDSNFLNNNINILNKLNKYEVYNYGANGKYTKDNLIITNNIINNKANNNSTFCLFLNDDEVSLNNCINNKMLSIMPTIKGQYTNITNNISSGSIILIENTQELASIIKYINTKGYNIVALSKLIVE